MGSGRYVCCRVGYWPCPGAGWSTDQWRQKFGNATDGIDGPAIFESIHLHFKLAGHNLSEKQVARAIELSAEKYCSASIMMKNAGVKVTHDFEILKDHE